LIKVQFLSFISSQEKDAQVNFHILQLRVGPHWVPSTPQKKIHEKQKTQTVMKIIVIFNGERSYLLDN
jgi:hypothetical protein